MKDFANLETNRFKTCGFGKPIYDQDGHYDEVACGFNKEVRFCGECPCPLDEMDKEEER